MKTAILLAAYGASNPQAKKSLARFEQLCRARFPGFPIRWAYSSELLRNRLAAQKQKSDSVGKALLRLHYENFTRVILQPLQTIAGREHEAIRTISASVCAATGMRCRVGSPLLLEEGSPHILAQALALQLPNAMRAEDHAIFMGHGASHTAGQIYQTLHEELHHLDPRLHVGTMSSVRPLESILAELDCRTVWLLPLLSTIGTHALRDMAGTSAKSWLNRIRSAGFDCKPVLKGMIEFEPVCGIWLDHLTAAIADCS